MTTYTLTLAGAVGEQFARAKQFVDQISSTVEVKLGSIKPEQGANWYSLQVDSELGAEAMRAFLGQQMPGHAFAVPGGVIDKQGKRADESSSFVVVLSETDLQTVSP